MQAGGWASEPPKGQSPWTDSPGGTEPGRPQVREEEGVCVKRLGTGTGTA